MFYPLLCNLCREIRDLFDEEREAIIKDVEWKGRHDAILHTAFNYNRQHMFVDRIDEKSNLNVEMRRDARRESAMNMQ